LLCFRCNFGLGWFQDDVIRLSKAVQHLAGINVSLTKRVPRGRSTRKRSNSRHVNVGFPE
jgi:hypothetical protein